MSEWAMKRFWTEASVSREAEGFAVHLDGRPVRTPNKTLLAVPTEPLARAVAEEWDAQEDKVDPRKMPFTRMANSALDKVSAQHADVADLLAAYGDSDLLCYRADRPEALVTLQAEGWDPLLDWAAARFGARLTVQTGVMHKAQAPDALAALSAEVHAQDSFQLAAFHDLVAMSGSLILALAVTEGRLNAETAWDLSRLDEIWQEEQWGADEEANRIAIFKRGEFLHAAHFHALSRP